MFWSSRGEILTSGGRCRCFWNCPRPAVGMFSHRMKRQHYWLPSLGHVTQVMWLRRTWPIGLAAERRRRCGHLNRTNPRGPRATDLRPRERGGDRQPHQTPGASHSLGDTQSAGPGIQYGEDSEVTHTDGHTHPRACFSACILCSDLQLNQTFISNLFVYEPCTHIWFTLPSLSMWHRHNKSLLVVQQTGAYWVIIQRTRSIAADLFITSSALSDCCWQTCPNISNVGC